MFYLKKDEICKQRTNKKPSEETKTQLAILKTSRENYFDRNKENKGIFHGAVGF